MSENEDDGVDAGERDEEDADEEDEEETNEGGDDEDGNDDDSERADLGDHMNALIKAAAIWLTEQDEAQDAARQGKSSKGRTLPSKRRDRDESSSKASKGGRAATSLPTSSKRRRTNN